VTDAGRRRLRAVHTRAARIALAALLGAGGAPVLSHDSASSAPPHPSARPAAAPIPGVSPHGAPDTVATGFDEHLEALLARAGGLLAQGRAHEAFALLEPATVRHAGRVPFDYLLGLAALDAGRPGAAVFALERVLATEPGHLPARAEIARAYLQLRELDAARLEFEALAGGALPAPVRDTVRRYLDTVERLDDRRARWIRTLEAALGHDGNVNFGSSFTEWALADGRALVPLPASLPRESAFGSLSLGLARAAPLDGRIDWTAGLQLAQRVNASQHNVDTGAAELSAGLSMTDGPQRYSMSVQHQHLRLDDAAWRNATGGVVQWQSTVGPRTELGAYGQAFALRFPGQPVRDARRAGGGLTLAHGFPGSAAATVAGGLHAGRERAGAGQLSHDFAGARLALGAALAPRWRAAAAAGFERRAFDAPEPLFGATRVDRQLDARLSLEWEHSATTTLAPTIAWTRNRSSLAPSDFRRTQVFVQARVRF